MHVEYLIMLQMYTEDILDSSFSIYKHLYSK